MTIKKSLLRCGWLGALACVSLAQAYEQPASVLSSGGGATAQGRYRQVGVLGQGIMGTAMAADVEVNYPGMTGILTAGPDPGVSHFADVAVGYWAHLGIESIYAAGITTGCGGLPRLYCLTDAVTRAQMGVFLERAMRGSGYSPPAATGVFADVAPGYWAAGMIEALYADGVTAGCAQSPLRYCPEDPVTRAQMAVFLLRAKHGGGYVPPVATGVFSDVPPVYWAANWIEALYSEGITTGCGSGPLRYCPETSVSRDQMAVFLKRAFGLP